MCYRNKIIGLLASRKSASITPSVPQYKSETRKHLFDKYLNKANFSRDGIHLSPEGSKIVANEILAVLEETDWEPNLHWKSLPTEFSEDSPYDILSLDGKTTVNLCDLDFYRRN